MSICKYLSLAIAVTLLSGCSLLFGEHGPFRDRSLDYQKSVVEPRMKVPDGMTVTGMQDLYPVPDEKQRVHYQHEKKFDPPKPPRLKVIAQQQSADTEAPAPTSPKSAHVELTRDGNGYPILMMHTQFQWAWEFVGEALGKTDLKIDDRDRESGIYYLKLPASLGVKDNQAQIKLSHTANGVQVAVLNRKGSELLAKEPGQTILQKLYGKL